MTLRIFAAWCLFTASGVWAGSWADGVWRDLATASVSEPDGRVSSVTARIITRDATYRRMVFLVEGFDLRDGSVKEFSLDSLERLSDSLFFFKGTPDETSLKNQLINSGYTVVLVDFDFNWNPLGSQAYALGNLIQSLWNDSPKTEPVKVLGFDGGGGVATRMTGVKGACKGRSAIAGEPGDATIVNAWNFKINCCTAWDDPHPGASVPAIVSAALDRATGAVNARDDLAADEITTWGREKQPELRAAQ